MKCGLLVRTGVSVRVVDDGDVLDEFVCRPPFLCTSSMGTTRSYWTVTLRDSGDCKYLGKNKF